MVFEIPVTCGGLGSDYCKAVRKFRKRKLLLHIHVARRRKLFYGLLTLQGLFSKCESRIYVVYEKANAVKLTETYLHPYQHGNAGPESLSGALLKELF